ncbi:MAG: MMPL family transporter, partial [Dehalococcoidia bacterium]|nr:MMPL family transporter [Dehalococcoidia bacterium]
MSTLLYRLGSWSARHGWRVLLSWLLLVVAVTALAQAAGGELSDDLSIPGTETQQATDLLEERFAAFAGGSATVVFHVEEGVNDPAAVPIIEATLDRVRELPHVVAVSNPLAPESAAQVSADGTIAYAD